MKANYDKIAEQYQEGEKINPYKLEIMLPNLINSCGDIKGKSVLDVGCGYGAFSRYLAEHGTKVVGIDISQQEIEIAKRIEKARKQDISYSVADILEYRHASLFEIVTSCVSLHYASDEQKFRKQFENLYNCLTSHGRLFALIVNPENPIGNWNFLESASLQKKLKGGAILRRKLKNFDGKVFLEFDNYYWSKQDYEIALNHAGFKDVKWIPCRPPREVIGKYSAFDWSQDLENPPFVIFSAEK